MKSSEVAFSGACAEAVSSGWVARVGVVEPTAWRVGGCVDARCVWTLLVVAAVRWWAVCAGPAVGLWRLG